METANTKKAQTTFMPEFTFILDISSLLSAKAVNASHGSARRKILQVDRKTANKSLLSPSVGFYCYKCFPLCKTIGSHHTLQKHYLEFTLPVILQWRAMG